MTDRKTAAELCMTLLRLAAVEEEREAAPVDYGGMRAEHRKACDALANVRDTLGARDKESAVLAAERAMDAIYSSHRKAVDAERIAADALRVGLEECERLRAELVKLATERSLLDAARDELRAGRAQLESARAALNGDREKVGEWWEVRVGGSVRRACQTNAEAKNYIQTRWWSHDARVMRVVHVTRWRKKR